MVSPNHPFFYPSFCDKGLRINLRKFPRSIEFTDAMRSPYSVENYNPERPYGSIEVRNQQHLQRPNYGMINNAIEHHCEL